MINVWNQPSLKHDNNLHVTTPTPSGLENHTVASLIHHDSSSWSLDLLRQIFNANYSLAIQSIPLLYVASDDSLTWSFTRNDEYLVCTAYRHLMESMLQNDHLKVEGKWQLLCQLHVPPKVKHFIWHLRWDFLPTRQRLKTKGVPCTNLCSYCSTNFENAWHVMFGCKQVEHVWEASGLVEFVSDHVFGAESLNQLVFSLLESLNTNQQQIFCMTLWCIRYHRNQWIWETWIHNQQLQFISLCIVTMNGPMPMPSTDQIVILDNNNPLLLGQNLPRDFSRSISTLRSTNLPIHYILKGILNLERQRQWVFCMV